MRKEVKKVEDAQQKGGQAEFEQWCVIELFGHQRLAGKVTEATIGGCSFLRVDVPDKAGEFIMTRYYGNGAIYSMTPVSKEIAVAVASHCAPSPVHTYEVQQLLPGRSSEDDDDGF